jgi:hypothetical protein
MQESFFPVLKNPFGARFNSRPKWIFLLAIIKRIGCGLMWRKVLLAWVVLASLVGGMQMAMAAPDSSKAVLIKGFWFADGVLADDPRNMSWQGIPDQPVTLYAGPSLMTAIVGELATGTRAGILDIAFEAYPVLQQIRATATATSSDGLIRVEAGDRIRLVCYLGDAAAAYIGDELVLVDIYELKLRDQIRPEWRDTLSGDNQWLQLRTPEGKEGWAKFYAEGSRSARGRWRIQPRAVGGSSNFNVIVFSDEMPHFQRLPLLTTR